MNDIVYTRRALKAREEVDANHSILIKYRVFPRPGTEVDTLAVSVAASLVLGVRQALPWFQDPGRHLAVVDLAEHGDSVTFEVAVPLDQLGSRLNIPHLLAIAWMPAEYGATSHVWVEDIRLPPTILGGIEGPAFGELGLYSALGIPPDRPIMSGIIKPRFGGDIDVFLPYARRALRAGLDGLVDDELLYSPAGGFGFAKRVKKCAELVRQVQDEIGAPRHYFPCVLAPVRELDTITDMLVSEGIAGMISNSFTMGYPAFEYLAELGRAKNILLIDCSVGATMLSLPTERTGTSMELMAKLARFAGADGVHTGSEGEHWYTRPILRRVLSALSSPIANIAPSLPVVAGQVSMANIWYKLRHFGDRCMVNLGGGIWHHPDSPEIAVRQTLQALQCASLDAGDAEATAQLNKMCGRDAAFARAMDAFGYGRR